MVKAVRATGAGLSGRGATITLAAGDQSMPSNNSTWFAGSFTGKVVRFDVDTSSGGNTGATEIEVLEGA